MKIKNPILIPNPKLAQRKLFAEDQISFYGENDFATNGTMECCTGMAFGIYQSSCMKPKRILRYMKWLMPFIGFDWRYRKWKWEK
jgi:hypothetical protein